MDRNQETTQDPTIENEIVSEINDIKELPEGVLPINLRLIDQY